MTQYKKWIIKAVDRTTARVFYWCTNTKVPLAELVTVEPLSAAIDCAAIDLHPDINMARLVAPGTNWSLKWLKTHMRRLTTAFPGYKFSLVQILSAETTTYTNTVIKELP